MRLRLQQKQVDLWPVLSVSEEVQRNGVETENDRDTSSNCDVYVTCDDVRCL